MFRVRYSEVRSHLAPGWGQDNGETRRQRNCSRERAKLRGSQLVREDIRRKKLLPLGHFPKVALTPPLPQNIWKGFEPLKTLFLIQIRLKKNYLKTFGFGLDPPPPIWKMS